MKEETVDIKELINLLDKNTKLVAMIAPSFLVDFSYPEFVGMLRRLGFDKVIEVSRGAVETNKQLLALMKQNPDMRYITNPCPTVVRLIRSEYPHLIKHLSPIDSPMSASAKIAVKRYPNHKRVFIGPCLFKKLEAKEDHQDLDILVLTYKEIQDVFDFKKIKSQKKDKSTSFDIAAQNTRLYPISGGLAQSSNIVKKFTDPQYDVISSPKLVNKILQEFPNKPELRVLDILNCEGGCINGPGVMTKASLDKRRQNIIKHWSRGKRA